MPLLTNAAFEPLRRQNDLTYNKELGTWARICWTDGNAEGHNMCTAEIKEAYSLEEDTLCWENVWAHWWQTLPPSDNAAQGEMQGVATKPQQVLKLPVPGWGSNPEPDPFLDGFGGLQEILSDGASGWVGIGYRPVPGQSGRAPIDMQQAVTIIDFPTSSNDCVAAQEGPSGAIMDPAKCNWNDLVTLPPYSLLNYDGDKGAIGFIKGSIWEGNKILLGYGAKLKHPPWGGVPPKEFHVAKVTKEGAVLGTKKLTGVHWQEDENWLPLQGSKAGCVAFPSVVYDRDTPFEFPRSSRNPNGPFMSNVGKYGNQGVCARRSFPLACASYPLLSDGTAFAFRLCCTCRLGCVPVDPIPIAGPILRRHLQRHDQGGPNYGPLPKGRLDDRM